MYAPFCFWRRALQSSTQEGETNAGKAVQNLSRQRCNDGARCLRNDTDRLVFRMGTRTAPHHF